MIASPSDPPAPPWTGDSDAWLAWVRRASAGELRSLVAWGQKAMAADAPIGFPTIVEAPPAPLTPEAQRRLDEIRARRLAQSRTEKVQESGRRGVIAIKAARRVTVGPHESGAYLRALREELGLSQREAAAGAGIWRGQVAYVELEQRPDVNARRKLLALYRSLQLKRAA